MKTILYRGTTFLCPFSTVIPRHNKRDMANLRESIKKRKGIRVPVKIYFDQTLNEANCVLDGEGRLGLAAEFDLPIEFENIGEMTTEQARAFSHDLNVARRQMTDEEVQQQRQERIEKVVQLREAGNSLRTIADEVGVSKSQIEADIALNSRVQGVDTCDVEPPKEIKGRDGKTYIPSGICLLDGVVVCKRCKRIKAPIKGCMQCKEAREKAEKPRLSKAKSKDKKALGWKDFDRAISTLNAVLGEARSKDACFDKFLAQVAAFAAGVAEWRKKNQQ